MDSGLLEVVPELGAMRLRLDADFMIDSITRSDANGAAQVRTREDLYPLPAAERAVIDDFEAAEGAVTYIISGPYPPGGLTGRGTLTLSGHMKLSGPWLGVPIMQSEAQPLESVLTYAATVAGRATVHEPVSRRDPIVILRKMSTRRGSMEVWGGRYEATDSILSALTRGEVMMLRQAEHAGQDMYFIAEQASVNTISEDMLETQFSISIEYVEVSRPLGFIASVPGWDFSQLAASAPDFLTLATRYANFQTQALDERL